MPAAARKPKPSPGEVAGQELILLEAQHKDDFARIRGLKATGIREAGERGQSFEVIVPDVGRALFSPPHDPITKGRQYVLVQENFLSLDERDRKELIKRGMVKEEPIVTGRSYGSATVKLF